jgi:hypothetical protein
MVCITSSAALKSQIPFSWPDTLTVTHTGLTLNHIERRNLCPHGSSDIPTDTPSLHAQRGRLKPFGDSAGVRKSVSALKINSFCRLPTLV